MTVNTVLLEVENLSTRFFTKRASIGAVDNVSLKIHEGESIELWSKVGDGVDQEGGISWG